MPPMDVRAERMKAGNSGEDDEDCLTDERGGRLVRFMQRDDGEQRGVERTC